MFETVKNSDPAAARDWPRRETSIDDRLRAIFNEILDEPVPQNIQDLVRRSAHTRNPRASLDNCYAGRSVRTLAFGNA
tara:strand:- start:1196 stop:1429 length:234 start_codon:yes stop_codon:yes gene_type:complete